MASSNPTEQNQSRGAPIGPPQRWVTLASPSVGNSSPSNARSESCTPSCAIELGLDRRTEVVRRAPTAEGDAVVGGALAVDDQPAVVVERLAVRPADLVEERCRAAARWRSSASRSGRPCGDGPGSRAVKPSVARTTTSADTVPVSQRTCRSAELDDPRCARRSCVPGRSTVSAEPAHQPRRVDRRAVRRVAGAEHVGGVRAAPTPRRRVNQR